MKKLIARICLLSLVLLPPAALAADDIPSFEEVEKAAATKEAPLRELDLRALTPPERRKLLKMADQGNPQAAYILAVMYEQGDGTDKDIEKAKTYYKKAEKDIVSASYRLGKMEADEKKARTYFKKAADKGYVMGMSAYAKSIEKADQKAANAYFDMACKPEMNYDPEACYLLGIDRETKNDRKTAYKYFKKSAEALYVPGIEKYADYLLEELDYKGAFRLYQTAATYYLIGEDQQRLLDKRNEAGKHLLEEEKKEIILDVSR